MLFTLSRILLKALMNMNNRSVRLFALHRLERKQGIHLNAFSAFLTASLLNDLYEAKRVEVILGIGSYLLSEHVEWRKALR